MVILVISIFWLNLYDIHVRYRLPDRRMPWSSVVFHQETNLGVSREQAAENCRAIVAELNELGMEAIRAREATSISDHLPPEAVPAESSGRSLQAGEAPGGPAMRLA